MTRRAQTRAKLHILLMSCIGIWATHKAHYLAATLAAFVVFAMVLDLRRLLNEDQP